MDNEKKNTKLACNTSKAISDHKQLDAIWNALYLVVHTEKVCKNKKIFSLDNETDSNNKDRQEEELIVTRIRTAAINAYLYARRANRIRVTKDDEYSKDYRLDLILESVLSCDELLDLISIARPLYHLKSKKYEYWIKKVMDARTLLTAWYRAEKKRYEK